MASDSTDCLLMDDTDNFGVGATTEQDEQDELEYLSSATLTKRKDFIDREEEARNAPNRVLYYRRNADNDRLIQVCTDKLQNNPRNVRALLIRAASYVKKGMYTKKATLVRAP